MEIVFRNPFYLWALVGVPLLILAHFASLTYFKKRALKFSNFIALARVSEKVGVTSNYFILFLRVLLFVAIVFAIAGTVLWYNGEKIDADYVLAIDSSASMLAEDFYPTRFDVAKEGALEFVSDAPLYSSIGVIGFSGVSYIYHPLTNDKNILEGVLKDMKIMKSGGTDLGSAIVSGTNLLVNSVKPRVIVLLTDGRSNVGFDVMQAIEYANFNKVIVNTISIGTAEDYFLSFNESLGLLGVDTEELRDIAELTGGSFYELNESEDLENVYFEIARSKKSKVSLDITFYLLVFILLTLFLEWILINTKYRIIP